MSGRRAQVDVEEDLPGRHGRRDRGGRDEPLLSRESRRSSNTLSRILLLCDDGTERSEIAWRGISKQGYTQCKIVEGGSEAFFEAFRSRMRISASGSSRPTGRGLVYCLGRQHEHGSHLHRSQILSRCLSNATIIHYHQCSKGRPRCNLMCSSTVPSVIDTACTTRSNPPA